MALGEAFPDVLSAARSGASWAFSRLYTELAPAVAGYVRLQGAAEPDDLTSEVFLGAFRGIDRFRGSEQEFRSWVFTIAHRRIIDERRRVARRSHLAAPDVLIEDVPGGDVESEALDSLGTQRVLELCDELSADQRTVLLLRIVADLSADEVAKITGKTVGAVKALQRRGLGALRERVVREGARR